MSRFEKFMLWVVVVLFVFLFGVQLGIRHGRTLERNEARAASQGVMR